MKTDISFTSLAKEICDFINRGKAPVDLDDGTFNNLALKLFRLQFSAISSYRAFCESRQMTSAIVQHWTEVPAVPASAFKEFELTSLANAERTRVFHSSGTTEQQPSRHFHSEESIEIYETSLTPWFQQHVLGDWDSLAEHEMIKPDEKPAFLILTPSPDKVPNSSLVHMFETIRREFGSRDSAFVGNIDTSGWSLDIDQLLFSLRKSMCANRPIALMGTAFSFVHLLDYFEEKNIRYRLATGSRALETGGYKGRSRTVPKAELHALITKHFGIPPTHIVSEYGMSELSSQAYDRSISAPDEHGNIPEAPARLFYFPPWTRVQIISPETGREVEVNEQGMIRIFDLANVRSVMAIQTEDLAFRRTNGFELIGRAVFAEPRGCSLMTKHE